MKKLIIICATLALASCQWLDVKPSGDSSDTEIFSSQKGFVQVLNGAYIRMKDNRIYGQRLTYYDIEWLGQRWYNRGVQPLFVDLANYNYTNATVATRMSEAYEYLYKVVADVNGLLENIDTKRDIFDEGYYDIIKGEALALRAYCHLDALRLFGPMPTAVEADKVVLPYVTTISRLPHQWSTFEQFMVKLREDLKEAERLLADVDPILDYTMQELNPTNSSGQIWLDTHLDDQWLHARQLRMNYYAVLALRARAELWAGNKAEAATYAQKVIDAKSHTGDKQFRLGTDVDMNSGDLSLPCEHIFALQDPRLETVTNDMFMHANQPAWAMMIYWVDGKFTPTDIRKTRLWVTVSEPSLNSYTVKFQPKTGLGVKNQMPLLRLSELYFIAAETKGATAGKPLMDEFYAARGIPAKTWATDVALQNDVLAEYGREFYAEGLYFYAAKRFGTQAAIGYSGSKTMEQVFVVPMPQNEINYLAL